MAGGRHLRRARLRGPAMTVADVLHVHVSRRSRVVVRLLPLRASRRGETLGAHAQEVARGRASAEWRRATPAGPLGGADLRGAARH
eukprot:4895001-Prymnesium_polylepis.1